LKGAPTRQAWRDFAAWVEDLGYTSLVVPEHSRPQFSPMLALLAAAEATDLRLGTLVLNCDFHHPFVVARDAATMDVLSDGRFELGLGAGWMGRDYDETGIPWRRGAIRAQHLDEFVCAVRALHLGEEVRFDGATYRLQGPIGGPAPVQHPLPLLVGVGGPTTIAIAARSAQIVGIGRSMAAGPTAADAARDATAARTEVKVRQLRDAAGDRYGELELNVLLTLVDLGQAAEITAARFSANTGLTTDEVVDTPQHAIGSAPAVVDKLLERRERFDISYVVVRDVDAEPFASVVAALAGR